MSQNGAAMTILSAEASLPAMDRASSGTLPKVLSFRVSGVKGGSPMAFTSMVSMSYLAERTSFAASSITLVLDSSLMQESMMMSFSMRQLFVRQRYTESWLRQRPPVLRNGRIPRHRLLAKATFPTVPQRDPCVPGVPAIRRPPPPPS